MHNYKEQILWNSDALHSKVIEDVPCIMYLYYLNSEALHSKVVEDVPCRMHLYYLLILIEGS